MTSIDITFRYGAQPDEAQTGALGHLREVYGIRSLAFDKRGHTLRVDYDASRLSESVVAGLLRSAGLDLLGKLPPRLNVASSQ
jgi:hypothetical protein